MHVSLFFQVVMNSLEDGVPQWQGLLVSSDILVLRHMVSLGDLPLLREMEGLLEAEVSMMWFWSPRLLWPTSESKQSYIPLTYFRTPLGQLLEFRQETSFPVQCYP